MQRGSPEPQLLLGLRCWPQWHGWGFCPLTGDLLDPAGQAHSPGTIGAGAWLMQLQELRDRVIFADSPRIVPVLERLDMASEDRSIRGERERGRTYWRARRSGRWAYARR